MPRIFIPTEKGVWWSITINNPTTEDRQAYANMSTQPWIKKADGQIEKGNEDGTIHFQFYLNTESVRGSQVKKYFKRAHIEIADNPAALVNYCQKEETRVGELDAYRATLPTDVYNQIVKQYTYDDLMMEYADYKVRIEKRGMPDNFALCILDDAVSAMIEEGKVVEFMCSNPAFRTAFKTYFKAIMKRTYAQK
jgi:hypothetical protein